MVVNSQLAWYSHVRCNPHQHPHMTITNFNYEGSYLPGFICHIVVKADLGRSVSRSTPTPKCIMGYILWGEIWQPFWILQEKLGISCYFWIIWVINSQLALYRHFRCNPLNTPWTPQMTIRDFNSDRWYLPLNTSTQNLADEHTLADGPPRNQA